jgi:hypothetical protein
MCIAQSLGRTHAELLASVSPAELERWLEFYTLHPFGPPADWQRFAILAHLLSHLLQWDTPPTFDDFLPRSTP